MPVRFTCSKCQSHLTVSRRFAGRKGRCPNCGKKVTVPEISVDSAKTSSADAVGLPVETSVTDSTGWRAIADSVDPANGDPMSDADRLSDEPTPARIRRRRVTRSDLREPVSIARWVIYTQGALLGIVATTFFVFGLAVGNSTGNNAPTSVAATRSVLSGNVYFGDGNYRRADEGAVVIILPTDQKPLDRPSPENLRPEQFVPLDNPAIDMIRRMGGAVVRADRDGNYQARLDNQKSYWILAVSKNKGAGSSEIAKSVRAEIGAFFFPIEDLIEDRAFHWSKIKLTRNQQQAETIIF